MTKISAKIIADSTNQLGNRITTFVLTYPRIIHAEIMTHRMFSRNAASSRAVPFEKLCESVMTDPFIPIAWQKDHSGMQGNEYFNEQESKLLEYVWLTGRDSTVESAKKLAFGIGYTDKSSSEIKNTPVTKQLCNRLLEPFQWYTCIVTATEYENFFALRCPQYNVPEKTFRSKKDCMKEFTQTNRELASGNNVDWLKLNKGMAEIHLMELAECMWDSYNEHQPKELKEGEWHIPMIDIEED